MVKIQGWVACSESHDESDDWIPMKISWNIPLRGGLFYLRVSGRNGGEVELKIDSLTGALYQMIVIDLPAVDDCTNGSLDGLVAVVRNSVPVIDLDLWGGAKADTRSVLPVEIQSALSARTYPGYLEIFIPDSTVATWVTCGIVEVGVSGAGDLVAIRTQAEIV